MKEFAKTLFSDVKILFTNDPALWSMGLLVGFIPFIDLFAYILCFYWYWYMANLCIYEKEKWKPSWNHYFKRGVLLNLLIFAIIGFIIGVVLINHDPNAVPTEKEPPALGWRIFTTTMMIIWFIFIIGILSSFSMFNLFHSANPTLKGIESHTLLTDALESNPELYMNALRLFLINGGLIAAFILIAKFTPINGSFTTILNLGCITSMAFLMRYIFDKPPKKKVAVTVQQECTQS